MTAAAFALRAAPRAASLPAALRTGCRAFSTTPSRDASWGFIGLGQMGMLCCCAVLSSLFANGWFLFFLSRRPHGP